MLLLAASLGMLALGPLLYRLLGSRPGALAVLDSLAVLAVGAMVLFFIVPESIREEGLVVLLPLVAGLLLPTLIERLLVPLAGQAHRLLLGLVVVGLSLHQILDGVALSLEGHSHALPAAVVAHQLPAGIVLWKLLTSARGVKVAAGVMLFFGLAIVIGFVAGDAVRLEEMPALGMFNAFIAGSLLHVFVHTWESERHQHG
jgi:hypothetical protein